MDFCSCRFLVSFLMLSNFVAIITVVGTDGDGACPADFDLIDGSCYQISTAVRGSKIGGDVPCGPDASLADGIAGNTNKETAVKNYLLSWATNSGKL